MIIDFFDNGTEDIYNGVNSKEARKKLPDHLISIALRKFYFIDNAIILSDLNSPPGNKLELLHGNRKGQYSIRINQQYRICFVWTFQGPKRVEIVDYH
jgi:proteic killer suppression protein